MTAAAALARPIASQFGTPAYVYDANAIRGHVEVIRRTLTYRPLRAFFSVKANGAVAIARLLHGMGVGVDACSPGDLAVAVAAGIASSDISFTGIGVTDAELRLAAASSGTLVVDDVTDLARVKALAPRPDLGVRVNPHVDAGFHAHVHAGSAESQFGVPYETIDAFLAEAGRLGLVITGLHAHIGSDERDDAPYRALLERLAEVARRHDTVRWINLGGGFGTPREDGEAPFRWDRLDADAHRLLGPRRLELRLEPGAYLTMDAGQLLARVVAVKGATGARPRTVVVDANTNLLVTSLLYRSYHPITVIDPGPGDWEPTRLVGNLMQAGDVLAREALLPPLEVGALLSIGCAGAYASCRAPTFNSRPRPAEVLVDGGDVQLIRRAETTDDLLARDE